MHSIESGLRRAAGASAGASRAAPSPRRALVCAGAIKKSGAKNVVCSKTIVALPDKREKVAALLGEMMTYSNEKAKDRESGILDYQCVRDSWEEGTFHCYERYTNNGAMGRHNTDPVMTKLMEVKILPNLKEPMGWAMYEYKNGKLGFCCVPEGPKGEGGLDDATGASGAAGGASMKRTSAATPVIAGLDDHGSKKEEEEEEDPADVIGAVKKQLQQLKQNFFSFGKISRNS